MVYKPGALWRCQQQCPRQTLSGLSALMVSNGSQATTAPAQKKISKGYIPLLFSAFSASISSLSLGRERETKGCIPRVRKSGAKTEKMDGKPCALLPNAFYVDVSLNQLKSGKTKSWHFHLFLLIRPIKIKQCN